MGSTLAVVQATAALSPSPIGERFGVAHRLPVAADDPESPSEAKVRLGRGRGEAFAASLGKRCGLALTSTAIEALPLRAKGKIKSFRPVLRPARPTSLCVAKEK